LLLHARRDTHSNTRLTGRVDFTEGTRRDLGGFLKAAGDAGLFVAVRVGPYVCAEWDGGGLPLWLRDVGNFSCCRCDDPVWENEMSRWVRMVGSVIEPHLARHGGPVVMAQIENELHSRPSDPYVGWCGQVAQSLDWNIPWVMCNGASANNTINTCASRAATVGPACFSCANYLSHMLLSGSRLAHSSSFLARRS
jgi:beta-galactosidase GanA